MLAWIAIGIAVVAVLADAATIAATHFGGTVRFGDVSGWVGGIGSLLAAVTAVVIAVVRNNRQSRLDSDARLKAGQRAARRARRVTVHGDRYDTQDPVSRLINDNRGEDVFVFEIRNTGVTPVYDVEWFRPLIAYIPYTPPNEVPEPILARLEDSELLPEGYYDDLPVARPGTEIRETDPFVVAPGADASIRVKFQTRRGGASQSVLDLTVFNRVAFIDEDGYRLGWVYRRVNTTVPLTDPESVRGHWALVDDDYPNNVDDAVQELFNQAPPSPV